jgi:hypothetical protein
VDHQKAGPTARLRSDCEDDLKVQTGARAKSWQAKKIKHGFCVRSPGIKARLVSDINCPRADLLLYAKHLLSLANPPKKRPGEKPGPSWLAQPRQARGRRHRLTVATLARSRGDVPLVAATPVQDLRFRANDLRKDAKLTARSKVVICITSIVLPTG